VGLDCDSLENIRVGEDRIFRLFTTGWEVCCGACRPSRRLQIWSCQCAYHGDVPVIISILFIIYLLFLLLC